MMTFIPSGDTSVHHTPPHSPRHPLFSTNHILLLAWGWGGSEDEEAYLSAQHILLKQSASSTIPLSLIGYILDFFAHHQSWEENISVVVVCCFEVEMLRSQVILVALFVSSVLLVQVSGAPRRDMLTLRADLASDKVSDSLNGIREVEMWRLTVGFLHGEHICVFSAYLVPFLSSFRISHTCSCWRLCLNWWQREQMRCAPSWRRRRRESGKMWCGGDISPSPKGSGRQAAVTSSGRRSPRVNTRQQPEYFCF